MKQKTKQAASKRFAMTARKKVRRRAIGQAHFNSRESGNDKRGKRHFRYVHTADTGRIAELLPYA